MLSKQDMHWINNLLDEKLEHFARIINSSLETKADKDDIAQLATRMECLDTRMDGLDTRMDGLDTRMDGLDTRMVSLEGRMNTLEFKLVTAPSNRLDRVEDDIRMIKAKVGM